MPKTPVLILLLTALVGLVAPALANPADIPAYSCRNGLFAMHADHHFQLGQIQGKERAYFFRDTEGCPTGKSCQTASYVIPGDRVIINQIQSDWACVWYQGKKSETVGWVPRQQIKLNPPAKVPALKEWIGHWVFSESADILIKPAANKQALALDGQAFWLGLVVNGERVIHMGALGTPEILPVKDRVHYSSGDDEFSCKAELLLLPPYLIADDNGNCGGQNVTFRGVYTRSNLPFKNTVRGD